MFARSLDLARQAVSLMSGPDGVDPLATLLGAQPRLGGWKPWVAGGESLATAGAPRLAIPLPAQLDGLADGWGAAFDAAVSRFRGCGAEVIPVDIAPLLEAATLLYGGAFVAERYAAVGAHIEAHEDMIGDTLDPVVATLILDGAKYPAAGYFADREQPRQACPAAAAVLAGFDALLTPTTTAHPTFDEVRADPVGVNSRWESTRTSQPAGPRAVAVLAGRRAGGPFGIMLTGPAGSDNRLAQLAALPGQASTDILVVGAHLSGQPLNHELLAAGGVLLGPAATAPDYRLYALDTVPAKPGLVRVAGPRRHGRVGRRRTVAAACRRACAASWPGWPPRWRSGGCGSTMAATSSASSASLRALDGAAEITAYGGWRAFRERG